MEQWQFSEEHTKKTAQRDRRQIRFIVCVHRSP
jgi:hypothetical protein